MAEETPKARGLDMPSNPLQALLDPRITASALGILAAHMTRRAMYTSSRDAFGWAARGKDGRTGFFELKKDANGKPVLDSKGNGSPDLDRPAANAFTNRLLLSAGQILLGTIVMGQSKDVTLDYLGLGFGGSGFANAVALILSIE